MDRTKSHPTRRPAGNHPDTQSRGIDIPGLPSGLILAVTLFSVGLALRLLYLAQASDSPFFGVRGLDGRLYHETAIAILRGEWPGTAPFFRAPLYSLFLAGSTSLFGDDPGTIRGLQAGMGALNCALIFFIVSPLFRSRSLGFCSGLLWCAYGPSIYFDAQILPATLDLHLHLAAILSLGAASRSPRKWFLWLLAGLLLGLAALNRGETILLLGAVLIWAWRRRIGFSRAGMIALPALSLITPIALHNARYDATVGIHDAASDPTLASDRPGTLQNLIRGRFSLISGSGGVNFYLGNHSSVGSSNDVNSPDHFDRYEEILRRPIDKGIDSFSGRSRFLTRETLRDIATHPTGFARRIGEKALLAVNGAEIARNSNLYAHREHSWLLSLLLWRAGSFSFPTGLLIPFSILGLLIARPREPSAGLVLAKLFVVTATLLLFFVTARYRLSALPFLLPFALAAGADLWNKARARLQRPLTIRLATLLGLLALSNLPLITTPHRPGDYEIERLALVLQERGDPEGAISLYEELLARNPDAALAHNGLGNLLTGKRQFARARIHLERAVSLAPQRASIHNHLGLLSLAEGDLAQAKTHLENAAALNPREATILNNLGSVCVQSRDFEEGVRFYRLALEADPTHADTYYNLGAVLEYQGQLETAADHYRRALQENPEHERARAKLEAMKSKP